MRYAALMHGCQSLGPLIVNILNLLEFKLKSVKILVDT